MSRYTRSRGGTRGVAWPPSDVALHMRIAISDAERIIDRSSEPAVFAVPLVRIA